MKNFLLSCAGVRKEMLAHCPTEENKYVGLGGTVLVTAVMAGTAGYVFGVMALRLPSSAALLAGAAAGAAVFNLDRWLLSSHSRQDSFGQEVLTALPRIGMSLLVGAVISEPLVLRLYAPEIESQLARNQAAARRDTQRQIEQNPRYQQIGNLAQANAALHKQVEERHRQRDAFYQAYLEEAQGVSGSGVAGKGPVFREQGERLAQGEAELQQTQAQAQEQIAANQKRIEALQADKEQELKFLDAREGQANGLLAREQALEQLTARNPSLAHKRLILMLFLMMIDCLPVLAKLMQAMSRRHPYQAVVEAEEERALQQARVRTEEAKAEADSDIAVCQHRHRLRQQAEIGNCAAMAQHAADAQLTLAQMKIDLWAAEERQRIEAEALLSQP